MSERAPDDATPRFMSVRQVAAYLQVNEKKVYALASEGAIPATKITGKWLFPRELVDQWLVESSHGGVLTDRLVVAGSDDPLLSRVVAQLAAEFGSRALVSYTPTGTRLGLELLAAGRADLCAIHWGPLAESAVRHPGLLAPFAAHRGWVIVRAFAREQGLLVRHEQQRESIAALCAPARRWALRQPGSGSQRFLRETLAASAVALDSLNVGAHALGEREAAACVAMGEADVAPGTRAAGTECGLGFIPIGWEAFDLVLERKVFFRDLYRRLVEELGAPTTRALAARLGGYAFDECGALQWSAG